MLDAVQVAADDDDPLLEGWRCRGSSVHVFGADGAGGMHLLVVIVEGHDRL